MIFPRFPISRPFVAGAVFPGNESQLQEEVRAQAFMEGFRAVKFTSGTWNLQITRPSVAQLLARYRANGRSRRLRIDQQGHSRSTTSSHHPKP